MLQDKDVYFGTDVGANSGHEGCILFATHDCIGPVAAQFEDRVANEKLYMRQDSKIDEDGFVQTFGLDRREGNMFYKKLQFVAGEPKFPDVFQ